MVRTRLCGELGFHVHEAKAQAALPNLGLEVGAPMAGVHPLASYLGAYEHL